MIKTYSELITLKTFRERYEYLKIGGRVGDTTFGYDRYLNQALYTSANWKKIRRDAILRDNGCDLGIEDCPIFSNIIVHHINPITEEDILNMTSKIFDMENLITTQLQTHNAIHYADAGLLLYEKFIDRKPGDTKLW